MQSARMTGQVVLDAIIRADGTIGDVTVLRSTNDAFAQSAIAAVKQWRYTAPGFEGVLTVNVNFTLTIRRLGTGRQSHRVGTRR